ASRVLAISVPLALVIASCRDAGPPARPVPAASDMPDAPSVSALATGAQSVTTNTNRLSCAHDGRERVLCFATQGTELTGRVSMQMTMSTGSMAGPEVPHAVYFVELGRTVRIYELRDYADPELGPRSDGFKETERVQIDAEFQGPDKAGQLYKLIGKTA